MSAELGKESVGWKRASDCRVMASSHSLVLVGRSGKKVPGGIKTSQPQLLRPIPQSQTFIIRGGLSGWAHAANPPRVCEHAAAKQTRSQRERGRRDGASQFPLCSACHRRQSSENERYAKPTQNYVWPQNHQHNRPSIYTNFWIELHGKRFRFGVCDCNIH